jgi:hypothetical protein
MNFTNFTNFMNPPTGRQALQTFKPFYKMNDDESEETA